MQHHFDEAIEQHGRIVEILENKDCKRIEEIVRQHIIEPIKLWDEFVQENSPYLSYFKNPEQKPAFI